MTCRLRGVAYFFRRRIHGVVHRAYHWFRYIINSAENRSSDIVYYANHMQSWRKHAESATNCGAFRSFFNRAVARVDRNSAVDFAMFLASRNSTSYCACSPLQLCRQ